MNDNYIGENIKILRVKSGMTQQELAEKIGVSWEMVSRYERGQSSPLQRLDAIAEAFDTTPGDLLQKDYVSNELNDAISLFIPHFTELPEKLDFSADKTHSHYTAPTWILKNHPDSFVIDPSLIDEYTVQINASGPIFIAPSKRMSENELHLVKRGNHLHIIPKNKGKSNDEVIGFVIAQEVRFV